MEWVTVVAIVVLLVAIALPTLHGARTQAQSVMCLSRLRQLGRTAMLWADENGGATFPSSRQWQVLLQLHDLCKPNKLLFCPRAVTFLSEGGREPFAAYNAFSFGVYSSQEKRASTKDCGSNSAMSSGFSPKPMNLTGMSSWSLIAMTMPPRAVPSSLARKMPVTLIASVNSLA